MPLNIKYLAVNMIIAFAVCIAQISGSTVVIMLCLGIFLAYIGWACSANYTLPMLLFFLPWSQILRVGPESFSFYTFGLVLVCAISVVKKRFWFKRYHIVAGVLLLAVSLLAKLLDGYGLAFDYIAFIMMVFLLPVVKEEAESQRYDFFGITVFFAVGIVMAALCAQQFSRFSNIARYINIHSYLNIVRMSGFYGDPNYYTAQITAALGSVLMLLLEGDDDKKRAIALWTLLVFLLYCGFLSGSKSFALVTAGLLLLWFVQMYRIRGKAGRKVAMTIGGILLTIFIATSALFSGLIEVVATRFSFARDISSFTTGRTELWESYLREIFRDGKILFFGMGFTNIKVNGRAAHNTIIQAVFQFGVIGSVILAAWSICFFRGLKTVEKKRKVSILSAMILICGAFVPWLALDTLFFDEFFLLQWFVFEGLRQLRSGNVGRLTERRVAAEAGRARKKHRTLRIVWR